MSKRIRIVAHVDSHIVGGAELSLTTLLGELDQRFAVDLVATDAAVAERIADNSRVNRVRVIDRVGSQADVRTVLAQIAAVRELKPDIVHVNRTWIWSGQIGIFAGLLARGARVVAVEHTQPFPSQRRFQPQRRRAVAKRLAALVAVGERSARLMEKYLGLPPDTVRTIHNGVEVTDFEPPRPLDGRAPLVGAIGRVSREKGYRDLLAVLERMPEARVIVVGEGPERDELAMAAISAGFGDRLELVGWQEEPLDWLRTFDILAAPSRAEGSPPLTALEAMMAGVPVVVADVGSVSEAVIDGKTGLLVPPRDPAALAAAVEQLLGDDKRRQLLAENARDLVVHDFSAPAMAARFESLYDELCATNGGSHN
jgi:glycosyltransferase involved in cell wall biosynthesis